MFGVCWMSRCVMIRSLCVLIVGWIALFPGAVAAQGAVSARDLQTKCQLSSLPNAESLSVSWTGECSSGLANGVGDVFAFSAGRLRYILRGQFRAGQLERQDQVRDCSASACADDVPPSLLRLHEQAAASPISTLATPGSPSPLRRRKRKSAHPMPSIVVGFPLMLVQVGSAERAG